MKRFQEMAPPTRTHAAHRRGRWGWALLAGCIAAATPTSAQITPDAPVINFRLPMFGEKGYPVWDLRGAEGRYVNEDQVDLFQMRLLVFDENDPERVEMEIISPEATMLIHKHQAMGDDSITVKGDNFVLTGQHWLWEAKRNRVVIDEKVKVTFFEELTGILQ